MDFSSALGDLTFPSRPLVTASVFQQQRPSVSSPDLQGIKGPEDFCSPWPRAFTGLINLLPCPHLSTWTIGPLDQVFPTASRGWGWSGGGGEALTVGDAADGVNSARFEQTVSAHCWG